MICRLRKLASIFGTREHARAEGSSCDAGPSSASTSIQTEDASKGATRGRRAARRGFDRAWDRAHNPPSYPSSLSLRQASDDWNRPWTDAEKEQVR